MVVNVSEVEALLSEVEKEIDRLNALYNQYFMGIEKIEPTIQKKNLERKIQQLRRQKIRNTALSFRLQMQIQRFNTQSNYWTRICRQIEAGTYVRHVMLAKHRRRVREEIAKGRMAADGSGLNPEDLAGIHNLDLDIDIDIDLSDLGIDLDDPFSADLDLLFANSTPAAGPIDSLDDPFAEKSAVISVSKPAPTLPAAPEPQRSDLPTPKPAATPKPPVNAPAEPSKPVRTAAVKSTKRELSREETESIFRRYLAARKKCNQPTDDVSFSQVASSLAKKASTGNVDFKVVIKNGKAAIVTKKT